MTRDREPHRGPDPASHPGPEPEFLAPRAADTGSDDARSADGGSAAGQPRRSQSSRGRRRRGHRGHAPRQSGSAQQSGSPQQSGPAQGSGPAPSTTPSGPGTADHAAGGTQPRAGARRSGGSAQNGHNHGRPRRRLRQVDEFSAGGLILDLTGEIPRGALIGRTDRQGRLLWSLPKGHIEAGETAEQAAVREVEEETGIAGTIVAELGTIDFWFVAEGRRIHKTVRHYLMRRTGGELSDADIEVDEVAWVPLPDIRAQLAYPDERGLVDTAGRLLADTA